MGAGRVFARAALLLILAWPLVGSGEVAAKPPVRSSATSVAQSLYQSWRARSPRAARRVAADEAVQKLFGVRWRAMKFEGCTQRDQGGFECIYRDGKADLSMAMIVEGGASLGGYNVSSLSFSSEE